nr:MAG TPA: hypothetical protein [Caudoviricetes sp.]
MVADCHIFRLRFPAIHPVLKYMLPYIRPVFKSQFELIEPHLHH